MVTPPRPTSLPRRCPSSVSQQGFTLIELLVVVIVLGVLASIALPSFLNQAAKAKQAGARQYIGAINRAQQAHFLEHASFATSPEVLGLEPQSAPAHYTITFEPQSMMISANATPISPDLRSYEGVVFATVDSGGAVQAATVICEGSLTTPPEPTLVRSADGKMQVTDCDTF